MVVHNLSTISFDYKLITRSREKPQPRSKGLSCSHLLGLEEEGWLISTKKNYTSDFLEQSIFFPKIGYFKKFSIVIFTVFRAHKLYRNQEVSFKELVILRLMFPILNFVVEG